MQYSVGGIKGFFLTSRLEWGSKRKPLLVPQREHKKLPGEDNLPHNGQYRPLLEITYPAFLALLSGPFNPRPLSRSLRPYSSCGAYRKTPGTQLSITLINPHKAVFDCTLVRPPSDIRWILFFTRYCLNRHS